MWISCATAQHLLNQIHYSGAGCPEISQQQHKQWCDSNTLGWQRSALVTNLSRIKSCYFKAVKGNEVGINLPTVQLNLLYSFVSSSGDSQRALSHISVFERTKSIPGSFVREINRLSVWCCQFWTWLYMKGSWGLSLYLQPKWQALSLGMEDWKWRLWLKCLV